jgi:glycosyltransferase involved in cell wall biosynthesis
MIVTDVGGLAESVPHEEVGFVVPPEAPGALAAAIARFFREDWQDRLVDGMRARRQRHHPDRLVEAVERLVGRA